MSIIKRKPIIQVTDNVTIVGTLRDGREVYRYSTRNRIVQTGRNVIRDLIGGVGYPPNYFAVGTGSTDADDSQTALINEVFRNLVTRKYTSNDLITFQFFLDNDEAVGSTLQEVGLFAGAHIMTAPLGGVMVARAVMAPFVKTDEVALTITWEIPISYVAA